MIPITYMHLFQNIMSDVECFIMEKYVSHKKKNVAIITHQ